MTYKLRIESSMELKHLQQELQESFVWLKERGCNLDIKAGTAGKCYFLVISLQHASKNSVFRNEDLIYIFKYQLSEIIADNIITFWEEELVKTRLEKKYRRLTAAEKWLIYNKALDFLKRCNENESLNMLMRFGRKNKIAHRIFDHLENHDILVIDGFINFCLRDYLTEIKFAIELACEEMKNEKEYNEFIKLLRYFVDSQTPRVFEVNLMVKEAGLFNIWDGEGRSIDEKYIKYYLDDILVDNVNIDDVLVSILITIAPRRLVLHSHGNLPDTEPIKVIKKVFRDRIITCPGCERCRKHRLKKGDG